MEHVAIDVGGRESQICVRSADGTIVEERRIPTRSLPPYLARRPKSRVVLETCAESFGLADAALSSGHEVRVVPATLVRTLGVGARRLKTDRRDAQLLSEVSTRIDLPSVHIPSATSRALKALCNSRDVLVASRTKLVNHVRGWLRAGAHRLRTGSPKTLPARVRELEVAIPEHIDRVLLVLDVLSVQLRHAEAELMKLAREDDVCRRLMTVPGVGPVTAVRFMAAIDKVERFDNAHAVESYFGLVPGEFSSSDRQHRLSITKAGAVTVRWTLVQAAWCCRRIRPADPISRWSYEVEKRRGKGIAVVALARKLAGVLYALWRDGSTYDPRRGAA